MNFSPHSNVIGFLKHGEKKRRSYRKIAVFAFAVVNIEATILQNDRCLKSQIAFRIIAERRKGYGPNFVDLMFKMM